MFKLSTRRKAKGKNIKEKPGKFVVILLQSSFTIQVSYP
jgi:hypothetical protein